MRPPDRELIHDWNLVGGAELRPAQGSVALDDETLRDGLQSPSVRSPSLDQKLRILHFMVELGIDTADIGLPGAGPHVVEQVRVLAREIVEARLPIAANCAARTLVADIAPVVEVSEQVGLPIEVCCFLGSSPVRQYAEGWDFDRMLRLVEEAVSFAVGHGLPCMFVTEDTTRARPEDLERLYATAIRAGASRVCIADTVGHATPAGAAALTAHIRGFVDGLASGIGVDWHGHRDRGLGVINALTAAAAGADRLHGTAAGIGERVGNAEIDLLLVNMSLLGWIDRDLTSLGDYCRYVSEVTGVPLPDNYPVVGRDAFRTGTGVHAAAIIKARAKGEDALADLIYSGVPAAAFGCRQVIEIGPMSGESNVVYWLRERGIPAEPALVRSIFERAKAASRLLADDEVLDLCRAAGVLAE